MSTQADVCAEVERRLLSSLLQESSLWLAAARFELLPGWNEQTLRRHELLLAELRDVFADRSVDAFTCSAAAAWLTGYCTTMHRKYGGACASDVLRRLRGEAA